MTVIVGDCREVMAGMEAGSVSAIVTDPPYELGFMGKGWDASGIAYDVDVWRQAYRVLKPGGHIAAFGGSRTYHRMAVAIEDAGFEIRDSLMWLYGSGFPKSLDVSKAIDRQRDDREQILEVTRWIAEARDASGLTNGGLDAAFGFAGMAGHWTSQQSQPAVPTLEQIPTLLDVLGNPDVPPEIERLILDLNGRKGQPGEAWFRREVTGERESNLLAVAPGQGADRSATSLNITAPATDAAREWEGWGTALKPAHEPIVLARKPFPGTVAQNVLAHGTGALNIDGARIGTEVRVNSGMSSLGVMHDDNWVPGDVSSDVRGRWPANVILDPEAGALLDEQSGESQSQPRSPSPNHHVGAVTTFQRGSETSLYGDSGGASRFFYCAKASRAEREAGLDGLPPGRRVDSESRDDDAPGSDNPRLRTSARRNHHPTVKPVSLMRWLVKLITPPGGTVLDPFTGSGTTGMACALGGFEFVGAELSEEYAEIARQRIAWAKAEPRAFDIERAPEDGAPVQGVMI